LEFILFIFLTMGSSNAAAVSTTEFNNLKACQNARAEVIRQTPIRSAIAAFCMPKGT
jgi:hypothetical protein